MAEINKHSDDTLFYVKHALRELPHGKLHGNVDIDVTLTKEKNYSLLDRCHTSKETTEYRRKLDKEIFRYKRKGLIKSIEIVIQCPEDCTEKERFFEVAYKYVCDKFLPMGERCVLTAQVHGDEHKYVTDETGKKVDISKDHLHIIAVPAVACTKHEGYEWKMSAHDLTSKTRFKMFHPGLQRACDEAGIHATVYKRTSSDGKTIPLTVKQLKEITNKTGIVLNHSVTVDELAQILQSNVNFSKSFDKLKEQIKEKNNTISALQNDVSTRNAAITNLQTQINTKNAEINRAKSVNLSADTEKRNLQSQVQRKDVENQKLRQDIQKLADEKLTEKTQMLSAITSKGNELRTATEQYKQLQQSYVNLQSKVNEKDFTIEALKSNIATLNTAITSLQTQISVKNDEIIRIKNVNLSADAEKRNLQSQVQKKDVENQKLRQDIQKLADEKLTEKNQMLAAINAKNIELQRASEQVKQLENQLENAKIIMSELQRQNVTPVHQQEHTQTWGTNHTWGMSQGWGNVNNHDKNITIEEEQ